jgi:hypothetical protein
MLRGLQNETRSHTDVRAAASMGSLVSDLPKEISWSLPRENCPIQVRIRSLVTAGHSTPRWGVFSKLTPELQQDTARPGGESFHNKYPGDTACRRLRHCSK